MFRAVFVEWGALLLLAFRKFFVCIIVAFFRCCCKSSSSSGNILGFFDEERRGGSDLRGRLLLTWPDKVGLSFTAALFCVIDAILPSIARIFARNVA